jgi:TonB-linked SusC/RagA family outer membrane protein
VEILKDAASSAIYGSRGANGVVLITTKKGQSGDTRLNFNFQTGFSEASNRREFLNAEEYIELFSEAAYNSDLLEGYDPINNPADYPGSWLEFARGRFDRYSGWSDWTTNETDTNWQDEIFRTGKMLATDLSAQGGNDKLKYFASVGYNKQEGILTANDIERISARLNVDNNINDYIDFGFALSLNRTFINNVSDDNAFASPMQLVAQAPITPVRDLDGELYNTPTTTYYNGLIDVEDATREVIEYRSLFNSYLNFNLYEGLKWRNEFGFDLYNLKENGRYGVKTNSGTGVNGYGFGNFGQTQNVATKSYLDYTKFTEGFSVSAVLGTEFIYTSVDRLRAEGEQFPSDDLRTLSSAGLITGATATLTQYSFLSYFARANFDYQTKYLFTLSGRADASSRFGKNNRYGFFPAASVGWVLSKESFLEDNSLISFLKLRTSYGLTGNAGIGNFAHLGLYGTNSYNSSSGLLPTQIPNADLTWENTTQIDVGLDFGFFDNRISGEVDYYIKKTTDLLLDVPVPATTGYTVQTQNVGSMQNKGIEFVLNTVNLTGSLKWNTSFNIAYNKNEVTNLGDQDIIDPGSSRYMSVVKVGQPLGVFYGAEYAGVDVNTGDAIWYVNETDADGNIINPDATTNDYSSANYVFLGQPNPDIIGAITNTISYKGVTLDFTFQGVTGNKIQMAGDTYMAANAEWFDNQTKKQLDRWQKPGDVTDVPQARLGYSNGSQNRSSRYLSDGAYLKLRSLTLSYNLPQNVVNRMGLNSMRVYMQGQNLLTFTKYEGWDPEVSADFLVTNIRSGVDFYSAPQPRTITFGINISL